MSRVQHAEETSPHFFALGPSFLDPQTTNNGEPYGPIRYKQLIKELYVISKNCYTPYTSLLDITPTEKNELIRLIIEEGRKSQEAMERVKEEAKNRRNNR